MRRIPSISSFNQEKKKHNHIDNHVDKTYFKITDIKSICKYPCLECSSSACALPKRMR